MQTLRRSLHPNISESKRFNKCFWFYHVLFCGTCSCPHLSRGFLRWPRLFSVEYFRNFQPVSGLRNWSKLILLLAKLLAGQNCFLCLSSASFFFYITSIHISKHVFFLFPVACQVHCCLLHEVHIDVLWISLGAVRPSPAQWGMVNMSELRKITEVPFPFPYSQFPGQLCFFFLVHRVVAGLCSFALVYLEWFDYELHFFVILLY